MKRYGFILIAAVMICALCACSRLPVSDSNIAPEKENHFIFDERRYTYTGNEGDFSIENDRLIIQAEGTYRLSGHLKEGAICVRVAPSESVRLILADISVQSSHHAPLEIENAACVTLELEENSVNTFTDSSRAKEEENFLPVSCVEVYSRLVIEGNGSLVISGRSSCALACSESIWMRSGQITLSTSETGIWVRDRFCFEDGALTVTSARCGVVVSEEKYACGILEISGGRLSMVCSEIALSAGKEIDISSGVGSLRAPLLYRCEQKNDTDSASGIIQIKSPDFPSAS